MQPSCWHNFFSHSTLQGCLKVTLCPPRPRLGRLLQTGMWHLHLLFHGSLTCQVQALFLKHVACHLLGKPFGSFGLICVRERTPTLRAMTHALHDAVEEFKTGKDPQIQFRL